MYVGRFIDMQYVHTQIHVCIYIYIYVHAYLDLLMLVIYIYEDIYICRDVCMQTFLCVYIYMYEGMYYLTALVCCDLRKNPLNFRA